MNSTASKVMNHYKIVKNNLGLTEDVSFNERPSTAGSLEYYFRILKQYRRQIIQNMNQTQRVLEFKALLKCWYNIKIKLKKSYPLIKQDLSHIDGSKIANGDIYQLSLFWDLLSKLTKIYHQYQEVPDTDSPTITNRSNRNFYFNNSAPAICQDNENLEEQRSESVISQEFQLEPSVQEQQQQQQSSNCLQKDIMQREFRYDESQMEELQQIVKQQRTSHKIVTQTNQYFDSLLDDNQTIEQLMKVKQHYRYAIKDHLKLKKQQKNNQKPDQQNRLILKTQKIMEKQKQDIMDDIQQHQNSYLLKTRDQQYLKYRKIQQLLFKMEKSKMIDQKKDFIQVRKSQNKQVRDAIQSLHTAYNDKLILLQDKLQSERKIRQINESDMREMYSRLAKDLKFEKNQQISKLRNSIEAQKEQVLLQLKDDSIENQILQIYKKY
ncbi:hypothetical protein pb186bvf_002418 [Paramecium bursaria]